MKRGQAPVGQIFIYILAIFIFAIILLYGYKAITHFIKKGEEVSFVQFKTTLETTVRDLAIQYGDVVVFNEDNPLKVPSKYKEVCFVDEEAIKAGIPAIEKYTIMREAVGAGLHRASENVFMIPPAEHSIYVGPIDVGTERYLCVDVTKGRIDIRLEGRGASTMISRI